MAVCRIVQTIPGATLRKTPKSSFAFSPWIECEEEFCEFEVEKEVFVVSEPFGDNSRYLIHSKTNTESSQMGKIRDAFLRHNALRAFFKWLTGK